jgi:ABC-type multidrug transport system ATPase subunit
MSPLLLASAEASVRAPSRGEEASRTVVTVDRLTKRFSVTRPLRQVLRRPLSGSRTTALDRVTFQVREGEIFGLLGPNGAGKTTLFKILSTLIEPDDGKVAVLGHDVLRDPAAVRGILTPVIPDERSLLWRLSAKENMRLYSSLHGLRGQAGKDKVEELLALVGLAGAGEKMVGQFSSGMRQRLLLARGLLASPRVLLLDEPTRSLDPVSAREFREFIRAEVAGKAGRTVLIATHSPEEALELCDRLAILNRGRLLAAGTAGELALQVFEERYRFWTTAGGERIASDLARRRLVPDFDSTDADEQDWRVLELEVSGGMGRASEVLATLVREGVPVARFEQVRPSLAQLMDLIVQRHRESAADA